VPPGPKTSRSSADPSWAILAMVPERGARTGPAGGTKPALAQRSAPSAA
jgi:hypothetical protein